ncbi:hypothetical protein [uncultured Thiodictyon sp.]|nr:hypothetical protein [uncultured Thiodictyon sp.]
MPTKSNVELTERQKNGRADRVLLILLHPLAGLLAGRILFSGRIRK